MWEFTGNGDGAFLDPRWNVMILLGSVWSWMRADLSKSEFCGEKASRGFQVHFCAPEMFALISGLSHRE